MKPKKPFQLLASGSSFTGNAPHFANSLRANPEPGRHVAIVACDLENNTNVNLYRRHADRIAQVWLERMKSSSANKKLVMIYLANGKLQLARIRNS
jgi:hypothetical protein